MSLQYDTKNCADPKKLIDPNTNQFLNEVQYGLILGSAAIGLNSLTALNAREWVWRIAMLNEVGVFLVSYNGRPEGELLRSYLVELSNGFGYACQVHTGGHYWAWLPSLKTLQPAYGLKTNASSMTKAEFKKHVFSIHQRAAEKWYYDIAGIRTK